MAEMFYGIGADVAGSVSPASPAPDGAAFRKFQSMVRTAQDSSTGTPGTSVPYQPISLKFASTEQIPTSENPFVRKTKEQFTNELCNRIRQGVTDRQNFGHDKNVRRFRRMYDLVVSPKSQPWAGASNTAPVLGRAIVDVLHANVHHTLFSVAPIFRLSPSPTDTMTIEEASRTASIKEGYLQTQVVDQIRLPEKFDDLFKNMFIDGTGITMRYYRRDVERTKSWQEVTPDLRAELLGLPAPKRDYVSPPAGSPAVQGPEGVPPVPDADGSPAPTPAGVSDTAVSPDAPPTVHPAIAAALTQACEMQPELSVLHGKKDGDFVIVERDYDVGYDAPDIDVVDVLHYGCYPATSQDQSRMIVEFRRVFLTADDLRRGVLQGRYDADAVFKLTQNPPQGNDYHDEDAGGDPSRLSRIGINRSDTLNNWDRGYECFEGTTKYDEDADGIEERAYFVVALRERVLLRGESFPYWHREPLFNLYKPIPRPGFLYGDSAMGLMESPLREHKKVIDQRVDRGDLEINAPMMVDKKIKHDFSRDPWRPGMAIKVDDPKNAMVPIDIRPVTPTSFQESGRSRREAMEVVGVNETTLGGISPGSETLGQTDRALAQVNLKFDVIIDRVRVDMARDGQVIDYLNGQYKAKDQQFLASMAGDTDGFAAITRKQILSKTGISVHGTSSMNNKALQYAMAEKLALFAERYGLNLDEMQKYEVEAEVLRCMGYPDYRRFIGTRAEAEKKAKTPKLPPPPEEKISINEKYDEIMTLALAVKAGKITPQEYTQTADFMASIARERGLSIKPEDSLVTKPPAGTPPKASTSPAQPRSSNGADSAS